MEQKTKSKAIPVTSFNDKITFPSTFKTNAPKIYSLPHSVLHKKQTPPAISRISKNTFICEPLHDSMLENKDNDKKQAQAQTPPFIQQQKQIKPTQKKTVLFKKLSVLLSSNQKQIFNHNLPLRRCVSMKPQKQILHMKTIIPDSSKIQRKIQQLRQIEHLQRLIRIINNKKVKSSDLENAYSLLNQKMRNIKMIENKFDLNELAKIRQLEEKYRIILRNKEQARKIGMRVVIDPSVEILEELQFQRQTPIQTKLEICESSFENVEPEKSARFKYESKSIAKNSIIKIRPEKRESTKSEKVIKRSFRNREYKQNKQNKIPQKQILKSISSIGENQDIVPPGWKKNEQQQKQQKQPAKVSQKLKYFIEKTLTTYDPVSKIDNSSTKQDISNPTIFQFQNRKQVEILEECERDEKEQSDESSKLKSLISRGSKMARRSSKFKFKELEVFHRLGKQPKQQSSIESEKKIQKFPQKLLTINTVTSQDSKESLNSSREQSMKYFKIMPLRKPIKNYNVDLLNQDSDDINSNNTNRRNYRRQSKRNNFSMARGNEDQFFRLHLNYDKSFVENRELLQYQSNKLAKFLHSKNQETQQLIKPAIHNTKQKNGRQYVSANMIQQLTKDLRVEAIGDLNNNFYEFEGFRYSTSKKDKIAYYGISDYTYKEDPWFRKQKRVAYDFDQNSSEDVLIQKSAGEQTMPTTTYMLNKIHRR